eukprot:TRINITY_DN18390_c0_g1_i1.p1 TRINITY_DN18390_c0_g1~~TRINITY_DN18390_c0_g1_i1.p1  ORF type:complete len:481 (+),score=42.97 TRINITY_DN18390_c0_g1_i1:95-1537(+)
MRPAVKYAIVLVVALYCVWQILSGGREVGRRVPLKPDLVLPSDFEDPPLLTEKDLIPPGPEPDTTSANSIGGFELGWELERWEARRLKHTQADYLMNKKKVDRAFKCLPDGLKGVDSKDAWKSRVRSSDARKVLPLTEEVQAALWEHQHPKNCKTAKFLVWRLWNTGLGADLHTLAQALGFAMASGRVLLIDTSAVWWYAMDRHPASFECFFVPPSSCKLSDAGNATVLMSSWTYNRKQQRMQPTHRMSVVESGNRTVANPIRRAGDVGNRWSSIPRKEWSQYGYQWWMAQTIRYLLRKPQPWFQKRLEEWFKKTFPSGVPKKMIGMHVRHGDKYKEMKLVPLATYIEEARALRKVEPDLVDIFVSTEDPTVLQETKVYEAEGWRFHWTDNFRSNDGSPNDYAMLVGPSMLGEISFTNLLIQEQLCTHWIGTDKSNWNRLINELRLTTGSYGSPYIQINKQRCAGEANPQNEVPGWTMGC